MKSDSIRGIFVSLILACTTLSASATIATVFDAPAAGLASFNATVAGANGVATHDVWTSLGGGTSIARSDYTITRNNSGFISPVAYGTLSGEVIDISPSGGPGIASIGSGVTLTFFHAINAIGFEVGDWGTCCQPSKLFISFDDGTPIEVGASLVYGDVFFDDKSEVFVGAFDDTSSFSKIQFWGDGGGEYLVFGGTLSYALIDEGSLPPGDIPEPATLSLVALAFAILLVARRRKISVISVASYAMRH